MAVSEEYRTGLRLLGREDAPFMPHRQPAGQSCQDLHRRSGIAVPFRTWQQLEGVVMGENRLGQILRPNKSTQAPRSSPSGRCTEEGTAD